MSDLVDQNFDLDDYRAKWRERIDRMLDSVLPPADAYPPSVHEAMRYSALSGGKRVRPILCVAGCEALGGNPEKCLMTGAAIEMVHAYSLIHDDLPAMDDDDLRRGLPPSHKKFGEAIAILAGDGLLTEAFGVIAADDYVPVATRVKLVAGLARAAGAGGMVGGQVVDIEKEGTDFTEEDLKYVHYHKTAAMIENAVASGGLIGEGDDKQIDSLRVYGRAIGLAFQIIDDVLNVTGGKDLGKGVGTDAARGKATYPALYGVDGAKERALEQRDQALRAIEGFGERANALRAIAELVIARSK